MLVVMQENATDEQIQHVIDRMVALAAAAVIVMPR